MRGNMSWLTKYICSGKRADPPYMIIGYHEGQGGTSDLNANFICFTAFRFAPVSAWNTLNAPVNGEERRAPSSVSAQQPIPSQSSRPCFFFVLKKPFSSCLIPSNIGTECIPFAVTAPENLHNGQSSQRHRAKRSTVWLWGLCWFHASMRRCCKKGVAQQLLMPAPVINLEAVKKSTRWCGVYTNRALSQTPCVFKTSESHFLAECFWSIVQVITKNMLNVLVAPCGSSNCIFFVPNKNLLWCTTIILCTWNKSKEQSCRNAGIICWESEQKTRES